MAETHSGDPLQKTPLDALHRELGGKMVPFAGYSMPVQYPAGIMTEHTHTREAAGLFDVSHMGQARLVGPDHGSTARALQKIVPSNIEGLRPGQMRYSLLLNDQGGIIDDLIVTRPVSPVEDGVLFLVVNASRKSEDYAAIRSVLPENVSLEVFEERALVALQGPKAAEAVAPFAPDAVNLDFMSAAPMEFDGIDCVISRCGYTGEDGFEISVPGEDVERVARTLLKNDLVRPIGLGARDSLRLEAGLCLYGHDIDEKTTPAEADLGFVLQKSRKEAADFPAADKILAEFRSGPGKKRIGLLLDGRAPAREGAVLHGTDGAIAGHVTSGGFAPTVGQPIAMGYVAVAHASTGTRLNAVVRGRELPATVVDMPFVPHRYHRKTKA